MKAIVIKRDIRLEPNGFVRLVVITFFFFSKLQHHKVKLHTVFQFITFLTVRALLQ